MPSPRTMLQVLLDEHEEELNSVEREAFAEWRELLAEFPYRTLSPKRQKWLEDTFSRILPQYENLVSSGAAPRGKEVEIPPILRRENLPMKPPGRR